MSPQRPTRTQAALRQGLDEAMSEVEEVSRRAPGLFTRATRPVVAPGAPPPANGAAAAPPAGGPPAETRRVRPWTPAAAMEPVGPAAPARRQRSAAISSGSAPESSSRVMVVIVAVAAIIAVVVVVISRLDLGAGTAGRLSVRDLALDGGRPVGAAPAHFTAGTSSVDYSCTYSGASGGEVVEFSVDVMLRGGRTTSLPVVREPVPQAGSGQLEGSVGAQGAGPLQPGTYTIHALVGGTPVLSATFVVDAPGGTAAAP